MKHESLYPEFVIRMQEKYDFVPKHVVEHTLDTYKRLNFEFNHMRIGLNAKFGEPSKIIRKKSGFNENYLMKYTGGFDKSIVLSDKALGNDQIKQVQPTSVKLNEKYQSTFEDMVNYIEH